LWLLEGHPRFGRNIRAAAEAQGVAAERVLFAPLIHAEKHLARRRLADLFLDSLPYNAHTTASDALWAGVPLVTCRGTAFPGRVAASLLHAIDLPELVTEDLDAFEKLAVKLASDGPHLRGLREKLRKNRTSTPLFDTARYCRTLEDAYRTMLTAWEEGRAPRGFAVPISPC
jgi:predicted O-linked N-acetylglucosamine transferase (SPINDLY family)